MRRIQRPQLKNCCLPLLRWQVLRVAGPLKLVAQDPSTGPVPPAAAHAAEGLQKLLGIAGTGQVPDVEAVKEGSPRSRRPASASPRRRDRQRRHPAEDAQWPVGVSRQGLMRARKPPDASGPLRAHV
ncbi:DUF6245 family protein [Nonomuraea sp. NPDC004702]